jgi:hypothetical protein
MYLDSISPFIRAMLIRNADGSVTAPDNILENSVCSVPAVHNVKV